MYLEETKGKIHFDKTRLSPEMKKDLAQAFADAGGMSFDVNHYTDANGAFVRETRSHWKTKEGYDQWLNDPRVQEYIKVRNEYDKKHNITTHLYGPYSEDLGSPN